LWFTVFSYAAVKNLNKNNNNNSALFVDMCCSVSRAQVHVSVRNLQASGLLSSTEGWTLLAQQLAGKVNAVLYCQNGFAYHRTTIHFIHSMKLIRGSEHQIEQIPLQMLAHLIGHFMVRSHYQ